jgi:hypothetical protein
MIGALCARLLRVVASSVLACTVSACVTTYDFASVPALEMRAAVTDANQGRTRAVRDTSGAVHQVDRDTVVAYGPTPDAVTDSESSMLHPGDVSTQCTAQGGACPLTDPAIQWAVGTPSTHVDGYFVLFDLVIPVGLLGGFVVGNVACVGENDCAEGVKVAFIVTDVVLGAAALLAIALVATLAKNFSHIGD